MLHTLREVLQAARDGSYAVGAFGVHNLEMVTAVIGAAEAAHSPVAVQIASTALDVPGAPLLVLCLAMGRAANVPVVVQLDHTSSEAVIAAALAIGVPSVLADGSQLSYHDNAAFTAAVVARARMHGVTVEGELGRLSGNETKLRLHEYEAQLTDVQQAAEFVADTGVDALAVCIGNTHSPTRREPQLDYIRLNALRRELTVPLVLHGATGLAPQTLRHCVELGISKINVDFELREAYLQGLRTQLGARQADLGNVLYAATSAMRGVVAEKLRLFGSVGKA